jgi:hypothetical protein
VADGDSCSETLLLNVHVFGFCCELTAVVVDTIVDGIIDVTVDTVVEEEQVDTRLVVVELFGTTELHVVVVVCDGKGY